MTSNHQKEAIVYEEKESKARVKFQSAQLGDSERRVLPRHGDADREQYEQNEDLDLRRVCGEELLD